MESEVTGTRARRGRRAGVLAVLGSAVLGAVLLAAVLETLPSWNAFGRSPSAGPSLASGAPPTSAEVSLSPDPSLAGPLPPAPTGLPTRAPVAYPLFGMVGHLMWHSDAEAVAQLELLREDGLRVVRFDVSWRGVEPQPGTYAYLDKLDTIIRTAAQDEIQVVISVLETPGWANGGRSAFVPPTDPNTYAQFVGMLARRYAGRVLGWEIWNEPDLQEFWQPAPDAAAYTRLLVAAAREVRAADPQTRVVGGAIAFGNTTFLNAMYDAGARGAFDALSVHPYSLTQPPDNAVDPRLSLTRVLDDMHATLIARGDGDKPIWITEVGWRISGPNAVSPAQRIDYLARSVALIRARPWVQIYTVYTIDVRDDPALGLSDNGVRSDAWKAYVQAVQGSATPSGAPSGAPSATP